MAQFLQDLWTQSFLYHHLEEGGGPNEGWELSSRGGGGSVRMPHHPWNHPNITGHSAFWTGTNLAKGPNKIMGILWPSQKHRNWTHQCSAVEGGFVMYFLPEGTVVFWEQFFQIKLFHVFLVLALGGVLEIQGKILHHTPIAIEEGATLDTLYFQKYLHSTLPTVRS